MSYQGPPPPLAGGAGASHCDDKKLFPDVSPFTGSEVFMLRRIRKLTAYIDSLRHQAEMNPSESKGLEEQVKSLEGEKYALYHILFPREETDEGEEDSPPEEPEVVPSDRQNEEPGVPEDFLDQFPDLTEVDDDEEGEEDSPPEKPEVVCSDWQQEDFPYYSEEEDPEDDDEEGVEGEGEGEGEEEREAREALSHVHLLTDPKLDWLGREKGTRRIACAQYHWLDRKAWECQESGDHVAEALWLITCALARARTNVWWQKASGNGPDEGHKKAVGFSLHYATVAYYQVTHPESVFPISAEDRRTVFSSMMRKLLADYRVKSWDPERKERLSGELTQLWALYNPYRVEHQHWDFPVTRDEPTSL